MADVRILSPKGAIEPTGTWSLGARAGDFVFVAGMRGIDPKTNTLVQGDERVVIEFVPGVAAEDDGRSAPRQLELDPGGFVQMELLGLEGPEG